MLTVHECYVIDDDSGRRQMAVHVVLWWDHLDDDYDANANILEANEFNATKCIRASLAHMVPRWFRIVSGFSCFCNFRFYCSSRSRSRAASWTATDDSSSPTAVERMREPSTYYAMPWRSRRCLIQHKYCTEEDEPVLYRAMHKTTNEQKRQMQQ